jgi:hypothetical protein
LGNTSIYLGNTTTTIGNLTLTNATISSGTVNITNVTVTTANVTNITVTGTANIATGNITTLTSTSITNSALTSGRVTYAGASGLLSDSSKLTFDTSNLTVGVIGLTANADGATGKLVLRKPNEASGNGQITRMLDFAPYYPGFDEAVVKASISSGIDTGTQNGQLGFMVATGGVLSEKIRLLANGNVGIGTSSPSSLLQVGVGSPRETTASFFGTGNSIASSIGTVGIYSTNTTGANVGPSIALGGQTGNAANPYPFGFIQGAKNSATAGDYGGYIRFLTIPADGGSPIQNLVLNTGGGITALSTIGVGNATPSASGAGITFPATQSASSDANTLDDYEEGTWTPSLGGNTTYNAQNGKYIKIGKMVYVEGQINVNLIGTGSTSLVSGLPFTSATQIGSRGGLFVNYFTNTANLVTYITLYLNSAATTAQFQGIAAAGTSMSTIGIFGNSTDVYFSGCYETSN